MHQLCDWSPTWTHKVKTECLRQWNIRAQSTSHISLGCDSLKQNQSNITTQSLVLSQMAWYVKWILKLGVGNIFNICDDFVGYNFFDALYLFSLACFILHLWLNFSSKNSVTNLNCSKFWNSKMFKEVPVWHFSSIQMF